MQEGINVVDFNSIMNSPIGNLTMNVLSNVLTDIVYWGYHSAKGLKNKKNQDSHEISTRLLELLDRYKDTPIDSGLFNDFLKLPQINSIMKDYVYYIALETKDSIKKKIGGIELIDYLAANAMVYCSESIKGINLIILNHFFVDFIELTKRYYYEKLTANQKTIVFFINERIEKLEKIILSSLKYDLKVLPDFEEYSEEYKRIIKRNNSSCLVYGFQEVKLDKCYVLPNLIENKVIGKFEIIETIDGYQHILESREYEIKWSNIFDLSNIVYLIGGAGYGKSIYLQYLINNYEQLNIKNINDFVVFYCDLKAYYNYSDKQPYSIEEFLVDSAIEYTGLTKDKINIEFINYFLNAGRCIILLDALDEVPKHQRNKLHNLITSFFIENNLNNKVCITSRARGFLPKHEIEVYEIAALNKDQIILYLNKMVSLKFFKKEDISMFLQQAEDLKNKNFLNSFLLLSLLVNIFKAEKKLPQTKVDLYRKCFDYMAKDREVSKSEFDIKYDWNKISHLMKDSTFIELACLVAPNNANIKEAQIIDRLSCLYEKRFGCYTEAENAAEKFLSFCSERTELFVPASEEKTYKFFHRSFFEYFYSKYICTTFYTSSKIYKEFQKFDIDTEIYELTVSMIKNDKEELYQDLVEYFFKKAEESLLKENYKDINILLSILQTVDEQFYKIKFAQLFIKYNKLLYGIRGLFIRDIVSLRAVLEEALQNNHELSDEYYKIYNYTVCDLLITGLFYMKNYKDEVEFDSYFNDENIPVFGFLIDEEIITNSIIFHSLFTADIFHYVDTYNCKNSSEDPYIDNDKLDFINLYLKNKSDVQWNNFVNNIKLANLF